MRNSLLLILLLAGLAPTVSWADTVGGLDATKRMIPGGGYFNDGTSKPCAACRPSNPLVPNSVLDSRGACTKQNNCKPVQVGEGIDVNDTSGTGKGG